jgi:hypothetical protein
LRKRAQSGAGGQLGDAADRHVEPAGGVVARQLAPDRRNEDGGNPQFGGKPLRHVDIGTAIIAIRGAETEGLIVASGADA